MESLVNRPSGGIRHEVVHYSQSIDMCKTPTESSEDLTPTVLSDGRETEMPTGLWSRFWKYRKPTDMRAWRFDPGIEAISVFYCSKYT